MSGPLDVLTVTRVLLALFPEGISPARMREAVNIVSRLLHASRPPDAFPIPDASPGTAAAAVLAALQAGAATTDELVAATGRSVATVRRVVKQLRGKLQWEYCGVPGRRGRTIRYVLKDEGGEALVLAPAADVAEVAR